jgi:hypothetical protein
MSKFCRAEGKEKGKGVVARRGLQAAPAGSLHASRSGRRSPSMLDRPCSLYVMYIHFVNAIFLG